MYDIHGDVADVFSLKSSKLYNHYIYDAFGNFIKEKVNEQDSVAIENPYLYRGYRFDKESGLYYLNARYYDPVTGRFISEDSYPERSNMPQSLNRYTYCLNQPIKYTDPTGYKEKSGKYDGYTGDFNFEKMFEKSKFVVDGKGNKIDNKTTENANASKKQDKEDKGSSSTSTSSYVSPTTKTAWKPGLYDTFPEAIAYKEAIAKANSSTNTDIGDGAYRGSNTGSSLNIGLSNDNLVGNNNGNNDTVVNKSTNLTQVAKSKVIEVLSVQYLHGSSGSSSNTGTNDETILLPSENPELNIPNKILSSAGILAVSATSGQSIYGTPSGLKVAFGITAAVAIGALSDVVSTYNKIDNFFRSETEETSEDGLFDPLDNHTVINGKLPTTGDANSSMDYVDDAGDLIRRRFFDENGNVIKDVDFTDHGNPKLHPDVPHEHYWEWNDGIPKRLK